MIVADPRRLAAAAQWFEDRMPWDPKYRKPNVQGITANAMRLDMTELEALRALAPDGRLLILTRMVRLFAFGFLSVVLGLYLAALGLTDQQIGMWLTLMLVGDAVLSLGIATMADRLGRRRMLLSGLSIFTFASFLCGAAPNLATLNGARALQAVGAALQLTSSLAVVAHGFEPHERDRVYAIWGTVMGMAPPLGPILASGAARFPSSGSATAPSSWPSSSAATSCRRRSGSTGRRPSRSAAARRPRVPPA